MNYSVRLNAQNMSWQSQQIIYNLHTYFTKRINDPTSVEHRQGLNAVSLTVAATNLHSATITKIKEEGDKMAKTHLEVCFEKRPTLKRPAKNLHFNCFTLGMIRRKILREFLKDSQTYPLMNDLAAILVAENLIKTRLNLEKVLVENGFLFRKNRHNRVIVYENEDIVTCRRRYIEDIKRLRVEGRYIVYLDETYYKAEKSVLVNWQTDDDTHGVNFFNGNYKGLIVLSAGGIDGFIDGALQIIPTYTMNDNYMNYEVFKTWLLEKLLPHLPRKTVIVMDNAMYHTKNNIQKPTDKMSYTEIQNWLDSCGVEYDREKRSVHYLLAVADGVKCLDEIERLVLEKGHQICWLPLYHTELNPLEMIWRDIKRDITWFQPNNDLDYITRASNTVKDTVRDYPLDRWERALDHVQKLEEEYVQLALYPDSSQRNNNRRTTTKKKH